jgi:hypothetical protein
MGEVQKNGEGNEQVIPKNELVALKSALGYLHWKDDDSISMENEWSVVALNNILKRCPTLSRDSNLLRTHLSEMEYIVGVKLNPVQVGNVIAEINKKNTPEVLSVFDRDKLVTAFSHDITNLYSAVGPDGKSVPMSIEQLDIAISALERALEIYQGKKDHRLGLSDQRE